MIKSNDSRKDNIDEVNIKFRKSHRDMQKKHRTIILIVLLCVIIVSGIVFLLIKLSGAAYDKTSRFYFSSDLLFEENEKTYNMYGDIEFTLYNFADSLRTSAENIDGFDFKIISNKKDITSKCLVSCSQNSLKKGEENSAKVTISLDDKYYNSPIHVEVTSKPVNITLKGTFIVAPEWYYEYIDDDNSVVSSLLIYANTEVSIDLSWDKEKLIIDNTNPFVLLSDKDDSCTITLSAGTYTEFYFFKTDVKEVYSSETKDFPIKLKELDSIVKIDVSSATFPIDTKEGETDE